MTADLSLNKILVLLPSAGGLAQLARALAWHAYLVVLSFPFKPNFLFFLLFSRANCVQPDLVK
jgi:hypothetical protein